jgi:choline dehydrogenase-like flavoprotein
MIVPAHECSPNDTDSADICIVGAGAAGITLACELDGSGLKIIVLEAGGLKPVDAELDSYQGVATAPHPDPTQYRRMGLGGTTSLWGGRCIPLNPLDFKRRPHVPNSGWPIQYEEVAKYYPRALDYCDAGRFEFTTKSLHAATPTIEGFNGRGEVLTDLIERYSLPTDFGRKFRDQLFQSRDVTVLLQARCTRLKKTAGGDVIEFVEYMDKTGKVRRLSARTVVLASGGIEVPRLLMHSDREGPGIGNHHDLLGRFYSCHFETVYGRLVAKGAAVAFGFEKTSDGIYCRRRIQFSEEFMARHELPNMVFRLHFPDYSDPMHGSSVMSAIYLVKTLLPAEYRTILRHNKGAEGSLGNLAHLRNLLTGLPQLLKFAGDWIFRMKLARRRLPYTLVPNADGSYPLEFNCEQTPEAANRITLTGEHDQQGIRRVHVNWRLCDTDIDSACRGFRLLRDSINASSRSRLEFNDEKLREDIAQSAPLGGHHIGTTRMGHSERDGVVDKDCGVFGIQNLFIASAAVFPTSGYANPSLTIVALAIRLAEHLKIRHGRSMYRPSASRSSA